MYIKQVVTIYQNIDYYFFDEYNYFYLFRLWFKITKSIDENSKKKLEASLQWYGLQNFNSKKYIYILFLKKK